MQYTCNLRIYDKHVYDKHQGLRMKYPKTFVRCIEYSSCFKMLRCDSEVLRICRENFHEKKRNSVQTVS